MNNGKICVSVCAETADEIIQQIKRAEESADIIEIRFDCLNESEIKRVWESPASGKEEISTFRPKEQGGKRNISEKERLNFWNSDDEIGWLKFWGNGNETGWADFEIDLYEMNAARNRREMICSYHDFNGVPENLDEIYNRLKLTNADVLKIAVQTNDITDSLAVWKLLRKAKKDGKRIVPIAMGEAGKWTRILGLAHGAPLTYAALDAGGETAPGQITARDMIDVYRVRELNEKTDIYGVVGNPAAHSLSPFMHNAAFRFYKLNCVYIPFVVKNLDEFVKRFARAETREIDWNLKGFSVTIPHKQAIIKHLDRIDETARKIGAVNTVKIDGGKLCGFNTDAAGFIEPLKNACGDLKNVKVAVLGNGGAARAAVYALKNEAAIITTFARNPKKAESLAEEFGIELKELPKTENKKPKTGFNDFDIVVNATPLGTKGELENETPALAPQIERVKLVYDLIYNPFETKFIKEAGKANVPTISGLAMLVAQGMKQFEIWTGKPAPMREMSAAALERIQN